MRLIRYVYLVVMEAFYTFLADDGWAIASHIALSTLMALFPFLIVLTSLAGFFGSKELADQSGGAVAADLAATGRGRAVRRNPRRADHDARRHPDRRRGAGGLFRLQRRRGAAGRAEPRLFGGRAAGVVLAAAGIDRLHAGRRLHVARDGVPDRARSPDPGNGTPPHSVLRRDQRKLAQFSPATASPSRR